jgi:protein-S-isoprenylcysteine O-methyltransferase Ste14
MANDRQTAVAEFKRIMAIIVVIAMVMVIGALFYLAHYQALDTNTVVATTLGVFFATALGCGLFAAAFFSDKSGHDREVTDASKSERERR